MSLKTADIHTTADPQDKDIAQTAYKVVFLYHLDALVWTKHLTTTRNQSKPVSYTQSERQSSKMLTLLTQNACQPRGKNKVTDLDQPHQS
jgi:hypothetical protein